MGAGPRRASGWWQRLGALAGLGADIALVDAIDADVRRGFAERTAGRLSTPPGDADVTLVADPPGVEITDASAGAVVDANRLDGRLEDALDDLAVELDGAAAQLEDLGAVEVDAPIEPRDPAITDADVDAVENDARAVVSDPVELDHPADGADVILSAGDLARVVEVVRDVTAPEGERLALEVDGAALEQHLDDVLADVDEPIEVEPVDAAIAIVDGQPVIEGGTAGYELDFDAVADQVLEFATSIDERTATIAGPQPEPDRTRADAEALNINEPVSSFTTEYDCCPPRVTNIQLMAEHVDGALSGS